MSFSSNFSVYERFQILKLGLAVLGVWLYLSNVQVCPLNARTVLVVFQKSRTVIMFFPRICEASDAYSFCNSGLMVVVKVPSTSML